MATHKIPGFMRTVLAANLKRLLEHHYRTSPNRPKSLSVDAGVTLSTIQRVMKCEVGASLDTLESIADALHIQVYQLLVPEIDVGNPQIIVGAMEAEQRLYARYKRAGMTESQSNQ